MEQFHNVSVRLKDSDYKKLEYLQDKFNRMSYGKVSLADVLRIAIRELHSIESNQVNKPVAIENQLKISKEEQEKKDTEKQ